MNPAVSTWIRSHSLWMVLFVICFFIQLLELNNAFRFDRSLIAQGHYWLLISGHIAHLNWNHFGLNMAALILVAVFFNHYISIIQWILLCIFSALSVGLGLYWFNEELHRYVGMSGVLHSLFIVGAWHEYRRYHLSGGVLLLLIIAKLIWEQFFGALPGSESMTGGHVVVDAHLYGAIVGVVFLLLHHVIHINNRHKNGHDNHQHNATHHHDE